MKKSRDMTRIEQIRRRRQLRKVKMFALVVIIAVMVLLYLAGVFAPSLALLGDTVDSVKIAFIKGDGWPQEIINTEYKTSKPLAGGFIVLSDKDIDIYSKSGSNLQNLQSGYSNPQLTSGETHFCIYDRGGKQLSVENRTRVLFEKEYEYSILLADMNAKDELAVVTESDRYSSEIIVYDSIMNEQFTWYCANEYPVAVKVSENDYKTAVATLSTKDGALGTNLYIIDSKNQEEYQAFLNDTMALELHWIDKKTVLLLTDTGVFIYDIKSKEFIKEYIFTSLLVRASFEKGNTLILLGDSTDNNTSFDVVYLDDELNVLSEININKNVKDILLNKKTAYILSEDSIDCYNYKGEVQSSMTISNEPISLIATNDNSPYIICLCEVLKYNGQSVK